jgi:hypothetical protein
MLRFIFKNQKNPARAAAWNFCVFAGVLKGVLENVGVWTWFFDGENVVECVVKRGGKTAFVRGLKHATFFNFIFGAFPKWDGGGRTKQISPLRCSQGFEQLRSK